MLLKGRIPSLEKYKSELRKSLNKSLRLVYEKRGHRVLKDVRVNCAEQTEPVPVSAA